MNMLLICYYNVDKLSLKQKDFELENMRKSLEKIIKDEDDAHLLVIPVREQETKIETIYIANIDKLI